MNCFSIVLLCAAALLAGCASTKPLLAMVPESRRQVQFSNSAQEQTKASYSTVTGRSGRKLISDGLLGGVIGETVRVVSDADGKDLMPRLRNRTGNFETALVNDRFRTRLSKAGVQISENNHAPALNMKLISFGLREVQRGFFAPYASAETKLTDSEGNGLWLAHAQSVGIKSRRKEEFERSPELYREDFLDVADDLSRQLVEGPIRTIER